MLTFETLVPRRQWVSVILKAFVLSAAICFYGLIALKDPGSLICFIIFVCASISSIAGFAFSALSGALLFHVVHDPVTAVQIMLIASISL